MLLDLVPALFILGSFFPVGLQLLWLPGLKLIELQYDIPRRDFV
jgi:hypothetical protein